MQVQACTVHGNQLILYGIAGWEWEGPWEADEWAYAPDWSVMSYPPSASSRSRNLVDFVRRKRWVRRRRRQQTSPGGVLLHPVPACLRQATLLVLAGQRRISLSAAGAK